MDKWIPERKLSFWVPLGTGRERILGDAFEPFEGCGEVVRGWSLLGLTT